ncbi:MAG: 2OG-Fe(II) oxygenase family protein [Pseudomonadota bacterium]
MGRRRRLHAPSDLPVIDIGALRRGESLPLRRVANQIVAAAEHLGCFYVSNHGVAKDVLARADQEARQFFAQGQDQTRRVESNQQHRGFLEVGHAALAGASRPNLPESFTWGIEIEPEEEPAVPNNPFLGPNHWPSDRPGFREALTDYFHAASRVGIDLLRAFALSMDIDEQTFVQDFDYPISRGSAIYYPPLPSETADEPFGVSPHTDFGCITVLYQDPIGGLEVKNRAGEWVFATPIPDTFVVNVGDLLSRWTNDRFQSTAHRVRNISGRERLSLGVFVDPNFETIIDPRVVCHGDDEPHYPPVRCGDYILDRYEGVFAYRRQ